MRPKQLLSETTVQGKTAEVQGREGIVGGVVYAGGPVISLNEAWCRHSSRGMGWRFSHTRCAGRRQTPAAAEEAAVVAALISCSRPGDRIGQEPASFSGSSSAHLLQSSSSLSVAGRISILRDPERQSA